MGTPNRSQTETERPWFALLETMLKSCAPKLKYLVDFELFGSFAYAPINDIVTRTTDRNTKTSTSPKHFEFHGNTQCVMLATAPEKRYRDTNKPTRYSGMFVERQHLLLTRGGELVEWRWFAEERHESECPLGDVIYEVGAINDIVLDGTCSIARFSEEIAREAVTTLHSLLQKKFKKDQERFESNRAIVESIAELVGKAQEQ